jgi:hypothetical protein
MKKILAPLLCMLAQCGYAQLTVLPSPAAGGGSGATTIAGLSDGGTLALTNDTRALRLTNSANVFAGDGSALTGIGGGSQVWTNFPPDIVPGNVISPTTPLDILRMTFGARSFSVFGDESFIAGGFYNTNGSRGLEYYSEGNDATTYLSMANTIGIPIFNIDGFGIVTATAFVGDGSGLTGLPTNIATNDTRALRLTNAANVFAGDGSGLTTLTASNLSSGSQIPIGTLFDYTTNEAGWLLISSGSPASRHRTFNGNALTNIPIAALATAPLTNANTTQTSTNQVITGATFAGSSTNVSGAVHTGGRIETNYATGNWAQTTNGIFTLGPTNAAANITQNGQTGGVTNAGNTQVSTLNATGLIRSDNSANNQNVQFQARNSSASSSGKAIITVTANGGHDLELFANSTTSGNRSGNSAAGLFQYDNVPLVFYQNSALRLTLDASGGTFPQSVTATGGFISQTSNGNAPAGGLGEYASSLVALGSAIALTTATVSNVTSISLTAGDWDVRGNVNYSEGGVTVTEIVGGVTSTPATIPTDGSEVYSGAGVGVIGLSAKDSVTLPSKRLSLSGTTTIYLVAKATFSVGTVSAYGSITARRVQ